MAEDHLQPGGALQPGQHLASNNGLFALVMETTGNSSLWQRGKAEVKWQSNTWSPPSSLNMQTDGNLLIINYSNPIGVEVWGTQTHDAGSAFQLLNDGTLIIWGPHGPVWQTDPVIKPRPTPTPTPPPHSWCCTIRTPNGRHASKSVVASNFADATSECNVLRINMEEPL